VSQEQTRALERQATSARMRYAQEAAETGRWIPMTQPGGGTVLHNPRTGEYRRAPADPNAGGEKLNEQQAAALNYGTRMADANRILDEIGTDYSRAGINLTTAAGDTPYVGGALRAGGNLLLSKNSQRVEQAQRNFINAVLRKESGATIQPHEFASAQQQYFPQPNDSEELVAQKRATRQRVLDSMMRIAGPGARHVREAARDFEAEYGVGGR
jgi:hypothetical protein